MNQYRLPGPRPSLLQRTVAAVVGSIVLIGVFIVGLFASVVLAGIAVIGAVGLSIWAWRQRRVLRELRERHAEQLRTAMGHHEKQGKDDVIEGEFEVKAGRRTR